MSAEYFKKDSSKFDVGLSIITIYILRRSRGKRERISGSLLRWQADTSLCNRYGTVHCDMTFQALRIYTFYLYFLNVMFFKRSRDRRLSQLLSMIANHLIERIKEIMPGIGNI